MTFDKETMYESISDQQIRVEKGNGTKIVTIPLKNIEFNTGNNVFQFFIGSNNFASNIDKLSRNTNSLKDWQFALGFNLNRYFTNKD